MIVFKTLKWKNFLSTGDVWTEMTLDSNKSTLVIGDNGAGKSTFLDALSYALYGKPFRKINKPQLINSINKKDLKVELSFQIGNHLYLIKRGMKPNLFEIWQNGTMINQDASARDYQDYLEKHILKLNHKSFSQIVVLGSSTFVPFMQLSSMHRREVIEDLLDLQIFSTMNTLLKDRINENEDNIRKCDYTISIIREKINLTKAHIEDLEADNANKINEYRIKIKENNGEINALKETIKDLTSKVELHQNDIKDIDVIKSKLENYKSLEVKFQQKLYTFTDEIKFFENHDNCPTCHQDIDEEFKCDALQTRESKLAELQDGSNQLKEERDKVEKRLQQIYDTQSEISTLQSSISEKNWAINTLQQSISNLNSEVEKLVNLKETKTKDKSNLEKFERELDAGNRAKIKLSNDKNSLSIVSLILKDTGIKTRIIKQYVPIMNKLINKYLAAMDFFVQFELDENFNETIKSRFRDEFSYASFSEGEKMRIDLALLFTWRAVAKIRNSASTNLLIMDEVFDSSLDASGTDEFLKILNELTSDTNVFIISHKGDQLFDKFENIVRFEKVKSFSRIAA